MLTSVLVQSGTARADIVRLKVGNNLFGQGWMFFDNDGHCKVVTAAHVVRGLDGRIRTTLVVDSYGNGWPAGVPVLLSAEPDIAVLPLPAADTPAACGPGRLSDIGAERRAAMVSGAEIVTTGRSEIIHVPVTRRASSVDAGGGGIFAVRPALPGDQIMKGWSGSVVKDEDGPIGIVFEVHPEQNEAYAVRVDVIRRLMAAADAVPRAPLKHAVPAMAGMAGMTLDAEAGPQQSLAGSGSAWRVQPDRNVVALVATYGAPLQLSEVTVAAVRPAGNALAALDVSTQAGPEESDWTDAAYCPAQAGGSVTCRFLVRTVTRVRLVARLVSNTPTAIGGVSLR